MRSPPLEHDSVHSIRSHLVRTGLAIVLLTITFYAFAAGPGVTAESPDWLQLSLGLFGGLALFLGGLQMLSEGLKKAAGQALTMVLAKLTTNRFMGAATGAFITGILNSSTVTTLLVVGFISGGMMTLTQSVGVIMGANIGSTVTAQLLAFNLSAYSLGPVAIGFFMLFTAKREKVKYYGMMIGSPAQLPAFPGNTGKSGTTAGGNSCRGAIYCHRAVFRCHGRYRHCDGE